MSRAVSHKVCANKAHLVGWIKKLSKRINWILKANLNPRNDKQTILSQTRPTLLIYPPLPSSDFLLANIVDESKLTFSVTLSYPSQLNLLKEPSNQSNEQSMIIENFVCISKYGKVPFTSSTKSYFNNVNWVRWQMECLRIYGGISHSRLEWRYSAICRML